MRSALLFVFLGISACSSPGTLAYQAPPTVLRSQRADVSGVTVVDRRDEKPNRVATIRGGFGNPLKVMDTTEPVAAEVQKVFTKALAARGMLNEAGPYRFVVTLRTLYGDQFIGRKAEAKFGFVVLDRAERTIYSDVVEQNDYEFTYFDNGVFSSIDTLGRRVEHLLNDSVDRALDKAALRDALNGTQPSIAGRPIS